MSNLNYHNGIVIGGVFHCLTDKKVECERGGYWNPCFLCSLEDKCRGMEGVNPCGLLEAAEDEYFVEAANVVYQSITNTWIVDPIL